MTQFRRRVIFIFLAATLAPLGLTLWVARTLTDRAQRFAGTELADQLSRSLEITARRLYLQEREALRRQASERAVEPRDSALAQRPLWPPDVEEFYSSGEPERFLLRGELGDALIWLVRTPEGVREYSRSLGDARLALVRRQYAEARHWIDQRRRGDLGRGLFYAFLLLAVVPWLAALVVVIFAVDRVSRMAVDAYQKMAHELEQSRDRLLFLTRLESWQALARKMAHEVKNSLTPIRLTMEELAARHSSNAASFERQAAQIVADEVTSLERRVRAFSELASEPPIRLRSIDAGTIADDRVALLRPAYPRVTFEVTGGKLPVMADEDLLKAVLTNLIQNAAEAAGTGGKVRVVLASDSTAPSIEVHDSGPGLSSQVRETLFEPAISFKRGGMGIGLSIARKSAVLCGGDIQLVQGELGGAAFRVLLNGNACPIGS